jgi:hypothetical protein
MIAANSNKMKMGKRLAGAGSYNNKTPAWHKRDAFIMHSIGIVYSESVD